MIKRLDRKLTPIMWCLKIDSAALACVFVVQPDSTMQDADQFNGLPGLSKSQLASSNPDTYEPLTANGNGLSNPSQRSQSPISLSNPSPD